MNTDAPAEVRTLLEPSSITPAEQDAAHASPYYVKLQHEGVARFGTAIVTDDHRVVVEIENGEMYAMQLTRDAAARLRTALESWTKGEADAAVELDPPNTYRGVGIVAEDGPAPGSVLAEVKGYPPVQMSVVNKTFPQPSGPASPGPAMFDDFPPTHVHGLEVPPFADDVEGLTEYGLSLLPSNVVKSPDGWPALMLRSAAAMIVCSHRAAAEVADRYREIPADPELQRRADNLHRAELVPLDVQIEAALRLVVEARAGEGDGACRECGHPVVQRRLASIQHALEQMRTLPGEVDGACTGDVFPTAHGAVSTEFLELFYIAGHRTGLRFEGLPDLYIVEADAQRLAAAVITANGERDIAAELAAATRTCGVMRDAATALYGELIGLRGLGQGQLELKVIAAVDKARAIVKGMEADRSSARHVSSPTAGEIDPTMLRGGYRMGPEPADAVRIALRLDWQDDVEHDLAALFAATEGARRGVESRRRTTEPEAAVVLVLPFEVYMLATATPKGDGTLLEHLQGEYPHVVCRQEITSDPYRERLEAEVTRLRDELQAIAERVGPAIGEGQIATQERRPGEVARAVRTLAERYAAVKQDGAA